jgi:hypothetical protein
MLFAAFAALLLSTACATISEPFGIKLLLREEDGECIVIEPLNHVQQHRELQSVLVQRRPAIREEHKSISNDVIITIIAATEQKAKDLVQQQCKKPLAQLSLDRNDDFGSKQDEVIELVKSGDPKNRIDVVLMGDGYTQQERGRFVKDSKRLVKNMWADTTFASTLPLFNVWAVFRPSQESGIGVNGKARKTAFGLYRDGSELRGVYCSKPAAARQACQSTGKFACDFPSLIGNDDLYGGLGGEFTITTRSPVSGTIVLRHELGHNLVEVGEEYDGGSVYSGVNSAPSLQSIGWRHWLTDGDSGLREEQNNLLMQEYPWYDLSKRPWSRRFQADGSFKRWLFKMSASGAPNPDSIIVEIDGKRLPWTTSGLIDRSFFEFFHDKSGFEKGWHNLTVRLGSRSSTSDRPTQLCSLTLHEFMGEDKYTFLNRTKISAYPTYSYRGTKTFRPTNEFCLMRNMSSNALCPVCTEGLWLNFLRRVDLIDDLTIRYPAKCGAGAVQVNLDVLKLGRFREVGRGSETLTIRWFRDNQELLSARDQLSITINQADTLNRNAAWKVVVRLATPEIRRDPSGLTTSEKTFRINKGNCKKETFLIFQQLK